MRPKTDEWFHESRVAIESSLAEFTRNNSMTSPACDNLFMGIEKGIKAVIVEKHGTLPTSYRHHGLVDLCKDSGFWGALPPHLQDFVGTMTSYGPKARYPSETAYQTLVHSSTLEEWKKRLAAAEEFMGFVQNWVVTSGGTIAGR